MSKLNYLSTGYTITDETLTRTSSTALRIGHDLIKATGFEIWTGSGKTGTQLTLTTDYVLSAEATDYTTKVGSTIYTKLAIVNGVYLNTTLYISYVTVGDYASVENVGQAAMETLSAASGTIAIQSGLDIGTRKRCISTSGAVTISFTSETCNGLSSLSLSGAGCMWEIEKVTSTTWYLVGGEDHGSNTNGKYSKRWDGYIECIGNASIPAINVNNLNIGTYGWSYYYGAASVTFPISITYLRDASVNCVGGISFLADGTTTGGVLWCRSDVSSTYAASYTAWGRWYA